MRAVKPEAEGTVYPDATFVVDPDRVRAFRDCMVRREPLAPVHFSPNIRSYSRRMIR